jgi:outer membrane protein TolC
MTNEFIHLKTLSRNLQIKRQVRSSPRASRFMAQDKTSFIVLFYFLSATLSWANSLTEKELLMLALSSPLPTLQELDAQLKEALSNSDQYQSQFDPRLNTSFQHTSTNEKAINPFFPVFKHINTIQTGISKKTRQGIDMDLSVGLDDRTGASDVQGFRAINTLIARLSLEFDLWQNFLGRMTKHLEQSILKQKELAQEKKTIEEDQFVLTLRRLFWNAIAIEEKKIVAKNLYQQAQVQYQDALKRKQNAIADKSEVARFESQIYQRKAILLGLDYQENQIVKTLKQLVPNLGQTLEGKNLSSTLALNIDETIKSVMSCVDLISGQKDLPLQFSSYQQFLKLLNEIEIEQDKANDLNSPISLKLTTSAFLTGIGSEFQNENLYEGSSHLAWRDLSDNNRSGASIGLNFSVPFGEKSYDAIEVKKVYQNKKSQAQRKNFESQLASTHEQTVQAIGILNEVLESQKRNSALLKVRLNEMEQKFKQARISLQELLLDQDAQMNSELNVVDSKLTVILTLLDYFSYFNQTPCDFNHKYSQLIAETNR